MILYPFTYEKGPPGTSPCCLLGPMATVIIFCHLNRNLPSSNKTPLVIFNGFLHIPFIFILNNSKTPRHTSITTHKIIENHASLTKMAMKIIRRDICGYVGDKQRPTIPNSPKIRHQTFISLLLRKITHTSV